AGDVAGRVRIDGSSRDVPVERVAGREDRAAAFAWRRVRRRTRHPARVGERRGRVGRGARGEGGHEADREDERESHGGTRYATSKLPPERLDDRSLLRRGWHAARSAGARTAQPADRSARITVGRASSLRGPP